MGSVIEAWCAWRRPSGAARSARATGTTAAHGGVQPGRRWGALAVRHAARFAAWFAAVLVAAMLTAPPAQAAWDSWLPWARARTYYDVDIDATPRELRRLLQQHLDIARFATRKDISDDQFEFLITATPQQVRDLASTVGYFSPVVRTDMQTVDGRRRVHVSVDPGPRTTISSVTLTYRGPVLTEFDGRQWRPLLPRLANRFPPPRLVDPRLIGFGAPVGYEVTLEPNNRPWLLTLDAAMQAPSAPDLEAAMTGELENPRQSTATATVQTAATASRCMVKKTTLQLQFRQRYRT